MPARLLGFSPSPLTSSSVLSPRSRDSSRELDWSLEGGLTSCQEDPIMERRKEATSLLRQKPHMDMRATPRMM